MIPVLHAQQLVVERDGRRTIDALNLAVPAGMVYALLGGNGAGKTTTINAFLGFVRPSAGEVSVDGIAVGKNAQGARDRLAYLPENVSLYPYLSGIENLQYFCTLARIRIDASRAAELLSEAGLQPAAHRQRASAYSKGMRQKVGLAIAHAKHAKAMLLDEPTSGLDPSAANEFAARIRAARDSGMAVMMATHDLFNAKQVADRIGIMRDGRLVEEFAAHSVAHDQLERIYLAHTRGVTADHFTGRVERPA